ncbi:RNA-binding protein [Ilyomonas limi]|uniref:RNA-binding protein n=1 Tax=Ilyomonas limi TaxID=2575867 RepID=A0A4U3KT69_9BACT|nr:RNA-binding protein [Ilyomonas limi]TKK64187.1 RNA-binding protein [Ilyomonas limi]
MNIFISGFSLQMDSRQLENLFTPFGSVTTSKVIMDKETGRSRGFGFVEMPDAIAATEAMSKLNGKVIEGKALSVNEARPKDNNSGRNNFR